MDCFYLLNDKEEKTMAKKDKYNSSGCLDMTAYLALQNVEREERAMRHEREKEKRRQRLNRRRGDKKPRYR